MRTRPTRTGASADRGTAQSEPGGRRMPNEDEGKRVQAQLFPDTARSLEEKIFDATDASADRGTAQSEPGGRRMPNEDEGKRVQAQLFPDTARSLEEKIFDAKDA